MISMTPSRLAVVGRGCVLSLLAVAYVRCAGAPPRNAEPIADEPAGPIDSPAPAAAPSSIVEGQVQGRSLDVESAIFIWRERADDLQIILSDAPDLCADLQSGAWPGGGTVLYVTIKHTGSDNRDAPFGAGVYPLRGGDPIEPQDTKQARFLVFGPSCDLDVRAQATAGEIRVSTDEVEIGGVLEGELELTFDAEITGRFQASFCAPAEYEPSGCR